MKDDMEPALKAALQAVPELMDYNGPVERLGGLTNRVFHVGEFCVRLAGEGTEEYIDRSNEAIMAREAANAGVSPEVVHVDVATGLMVTRFIAGAVTMSPDEFADREGSPARAGRAFSKLHNSGAEFPFRFELFAMIDEYLGLLSTKEVSLPDGYHEVVREAECLRAALDAHPATLAPCHCDPLCENLLDTGERMWIVDWEYSGMNDPLWDLGDLSVEGGFSEAQDMEMMAAYFGRPATDAEHGRVVIYKAMCDLLWTLWGLIQLANENPADDFASYSSNRFNRCKALMATPGFATHVDAVHRG
jgi:thiamine kinase-like enzyme